MSASARSAGATRPLLLGLVGSALLGAVLVGCAPNMWDTDQAGTSAPQESSAPTTTTPTGPTPTGELETGTVSYVVDGDTVQVKGVGRIRLLGIDTPEHGACGFTQATTALSVLVEGRTVTLTAGGGKDVDQYGRLLRYVDVGSRDAGLSLIEEGWAIARYDSRDGYGPHPREAAYISADAASKDLGCYPAD